MIRKIYNFISNLHWTYENKVMVKHRWCYFHHYAFASSNGEYYLYKKLLGIKFKEL